MRERRGQGAEHRFGNPHALRCIPIGIKRVSRLAVSRDNVRASPGRVRRRPEGRPSLISKSKRRIFSDNSASGQPLEIRSCGSYGDRPSPDARSETASDPSANRLRLVWSIGGIGRLKWIENFPHSNPLCRKWNDGTKEKVNECKTAQGGETERKVESQSQALWRQALGVDPG